MIRHTLTRRSVLAASAGIAGLSALAACGPTPSSSVPATPGAVATTAPAPVAPRPAAPAATAPAAAPTSVPAAPTTAAPTVASAREARAFVDVSVGDAVTMQPLLATDRLSNDRISLVYAALLKYDKQLDLVSDLATSYKVSDDKLSIAFELRDGLVWSDGKPITAEDVKFTFDKMKDEKTKYRFRGLYESFAGLEVTGPRTFVFRLKEVFAPALVYAAQIQPLPKHVFENLDINANDANTRPPVASGPYILKEWQKDSHATFVANDRYYGGRPSMPTYTFRVVKDTTISYVLLKNAETDVSDIQGPDLDEAKRSTTFNVYQYYFYAAPWDFIVFNTRSKVFADKRVRQALSHGLDKKKMIDRILLGLGKPQNAMFPSTSWAATSAVPTFDFDLARGQQLLDEAGWKAGNDGVRVKDGQPLKLTLYFNSGVKRREQIATVAQQNWKDLGVDLEIVQEEFGAYIKRVTERHDFDMAVLGATGGYEPHDQSNLWTTGSGQNISGFSNPAVDDLFKKGVTVSYEIADRKPVYAEIQKIVAEEQPFIFLWTREDVVGVNKRVTNVDVEPLGLRANAFKLVAE